MRNAKTPMVLLAGLALAVVAPAVLRIDAGGWTEAQGRTRADDPATKARSDSPVATIKLAHDLAHWGRHNGSPASLALAAKILGTVKTQPLKTEAKLPKAGARTPTKPPEKKSREVTPESLLAEARVMCGDDKAMLAAVEAIAKRPIDKTRSPVGGATRHSDMIMTYDTDQYRIVFRGNEAAEMAVLGDGGSNLDLYVYDDKNHLVASDTDGNDRCHVKWVPKSTGPFVIKIKNRDGVANYYTLVTN